MSAENRIYAPWLGDLSPSELSLSAPVRGGAILLNSFGPQQASCTLELCIDDDTISVRREDGEKMQFEVAPATSGRDPSTVLAEPVKEIVLRHAKKGHWLIEPEGVIVEYEVGFDIFASILAEHALKKQLENS